MLSEQDVYEQIKQMQEVEALQRNHFADLLEQVDNEKLRKIIQRFIDMENEHREILEELTSLYAQSLDNLL